MAREGEAASRPAPTILTTLLVLAAVEEEVATADLQTLVTAAAPMAETLEVAPLEVAAAAVAADTDRLHCSVTCIDQYADECEK